jgi:hypothetical protein
VNSSDGQSTVRSSSASDTWLPRHSKHLRRNAL